MFDQYVLGELARRNILFDTLLVVGTMGSIWILPLDGITWINLECFALILNAIAIVTLHRKDIISRNYLFFIASSAVGIAVTFLPLLPYPEYLIGPIDIIRGRFEDGVRILYGHNPPQPSAFISFVGMATWYSAVVGLIRLGYLHFLNALIGDGAQKVI